MNKFQQYIKSRGYNAIAEMWGITPRRAAAWARGENHPHGKMARNLVSMSCGAFTIDDIYSVPAKTDAHCNQTSHQQG